MLFYNVVMSSSAFMQRRDHVFSLLSAIFLSTLTLLNLIGLTRFVDLSFHIASIRIPMVVAVGVLPYPITFLCTDLISELFGRAKASALVWVGLVVNVWVVFILWLGGVLPGVVLHGELVDASLYFQIKKLAFGAVTASMLAYLTAQFCDVYLFHYLKELTSGRLLWLRNNASTMVSQLIDSVAVILMTHFYAHALPVDVHSPIWPQLGMYILSAYLFKFLVALIDTLPLYGLVHLLRGYLNLR